MWARVPVHDGVAGRPVPHQWGAFVRHRQTEVTQCGHHPPREQITSVHDDGARRPCRTTGELSSDTAKRKSPSAPRPHPAAPSPGAYPANGATEPMTTDSSVAEGLAHQCAWEQS